jgi:hypothetical protein
MSGRCVVVLGSEEHQRNVEGRAELTRIVGPCQRQRRRGVARLCSLAALQREKGEGKGGGDPGPFIGAEVHRKGKGIN